MSSASTPDFLTILDSFIKPVDQVRSSESEILQQVHKYFNSSQVTDNPVVLSPAKQRKINFLKNKLQHIACNPNRIQVIDSQVQALFELSWDTDMLLLLSTYYSCFYLTTAKSKPVLSKKDDLINELLYAVYHDVVSKLIENEMSYDDYFSNHIVMQLGTTKDPRVLKTYGIIEEVANDYQLANEEVVAFIVNCRKKRDIAETSTRKDEASENWPVRYLYEYIRLVQQPENSTLKDFLHEKKLHDLFTTDEIAKYEVLFKCYVTKLIKKEIRTLMAGKDESEDTSSSITICKPLPDIEPRFPIDVFDQCNIMILWLDKHIGLDENCRALKDEFRRLTRSFKTINTVESFRENLSNVKNRKLFCIIQGSLSEYVVPEIEQMTTPSPEPVVYIFCGDMAKYKEWAQNFECIMRGGMHNFDKDLLNDLTNDLNKYVAHKITENPLILLPHLKPRDIVPQYVMAFIALLQQYCLSGDQSPHESSPNKDRLPAVEAQ